MPTTINLMPKATNAKRQDTHLCMPMPHVLVPSSMEAEADTYPAKADAHIGP
jgi:hypothetical protein